MKRDRQMLIRVSSPPLGIYKAFPTAPLPLLPSAHTQFLFSAETDVITSQHLECPHYACAGLIPKQRMHLLRPHSTHMHALPAIRIGHILFHRECWGRKTITRSGPTQYSDLCGRGRGGSIRRWKQIRQQTHTGIDSRQPESSSNLHQAQPLDNSPNRTTSVWN
ncbi:uncharacterized protein LOC119951981 isoform X1 [Scyliorhinus canicula]|uniref:uncharacterized protein LOC119951981 isoform X1 n=1 Tax=Scyliorhinus canicula TaxID=7830 RepID=UPI0018F3C3B5|nr:uncharacterized protein LOC119951981 isoform X1 [Scyliorhinus canicula]